MGQNIRDLTFERYEEDVKDLLGMTKRVLDLLQMFGALDQALVAWLKRTAGGQVTDDVDIANRGLEKGTDKHRISLLL
jgi:hypothetical protein